MLDSTEQARVSCILGYDLCAGTIIVNKPRKIVLMRFLSDFNMWRLSGLFLKRNPRFENVLVLVGWVPRKQILRL